MKGLGEGLAKGLAGIHVLTTAPHSGPAPLRGRVFSIGVS